MPKSSDAAPDTLPTEYRVLPCSVDFKVPDFLKHYQRGDRVLTLRERDCTEWFDAFVTRLVSATGREFLPVCRLSDGEFHFMLGDQPPDIRTAFLWRLAWRVRQLLRRFVRSSEFRAATAPGISSGRFSPIEWSAARGRYAEMMRFVAERGVLALHLSYGPRNYFQERYFPALSAWLLEHRIAIEEDNYVPFYFVYAAFTGPRRGQLLAGRRLLLVHSAQGSKRDSIEEYLRREGAAAIHWCAISEERSFYDRLDLGSFVDAVDLALVGAGIGKPNLLVQLASLNVPAVDVGFLFEVWADPEKRWDRSFCVSDEEWDERRVRFLPPDWNAA